MWSSSITTIDKPRVCAHHVWRASGTVDTTTPDVWGIRCARCGAERVATREYARSLRPEAA